MKPTLQSILTAAAGACALLAAGCTQQLPNQLGQLGGTEQQPPAPERNFDDDPTDNAAEQPGAFAGGTDNSFTHQADLGENGARDPFEILAERQEEGPPEIRTRMHSCQKVQVASIRSILEELGVDLDKTGDPKTAGDLLKAGGGALGAANYDARIGEALVWSAAGAAKVFDIFVQAAPEIIANISSAPQCQEDGAGPPMFDEGDTCNVDAVTCLLGKPVTPVHLALCNDIVEAASDVEIGKVLAVATLLSAAHSCE